MGMMERLPASTFQPESSKMLQARRVWRSQICGASPLLIYQQRSYGLCSYLRLINQSGQMHCSLVMVESQEAPLKPVTIPRLELTAAPVSVKTDTIL